MFGDMMGKLQEVKQKMEETKARMKTITVDGEAENGAIQVVVTASREVREIKIDPEFFKDADAEDVSELTMIALNRALEKAEQVYETEMAGVAGGMMPGMGL